MNQFNISIKDDILNARKGILAYSNATFNSEKPSFYYDLIVTNGQFIPLPILLQAINMPFPEYEDDFRLDFGERKKKYEELLQKAGLTFTISGVIKKKALKELINPYLILFYSNAPIASEKPYYFYDVIRTYNGKIWPIPKLFNVLGINTPNWEKNFRFDPTARADEYIQLLQDAGLPVITISDIFPQKKDKSIKKYANPFESKIYL